MELRVLSSDEKAVQSHWLVEGGTANKTIVECNLDLPAAPQDMTSGVLPRIQINPSSSTDRRRALCSIACPRKRKLKPQKGKCVQVPCPVPGQGRALYFNGASGLQDPEHGNAPVARFLQVSEQLACMPAWARFPPHRAVFRPRSEAAWPWGSLGLSCGQHTHCFSTMGLWKWVTSTRSATFPEVGVLTLACLF